MIKVYILGGTEELCSSEPTIGKVKYFLKNKKILINYSWSVAVEGGGEESFCLRCCWIVWRIWRAPSPSQSPRLPPMRETIVEAFGWTTFSCSIFILLEVLSLFSLPGPVLSHLLGNCSVWYLTLFLDTVLYMNIVCNMNMNINGPYRYLLRNHNLHNGG